MPPAADAPSAAARDAATTKRLKKREIDRRCQREARQRTKSRIAYLEGLVEELRRKDTSGQVASLMQQVSEVRKERDMFARTLRGIEDSIRGHRPLLEGVPTKQEPLSPPGRDPHDSFDEMPERPLSRHAPAAPAGEGSDDASPEHLGDGPYDVHAPEAHVATRAVPATSLAFLDPVGTFVHAAGCECSDPMAPEEIPDPATVAMDRKDMWRFAHAILDGPPQVSPKLLRWDDEHRDDIPVRAITEGWPAVEARLGGHLPPLWRKLRHIDETVFGNIGKVERLAILRIMHLLLRYHADPTSQMAKIPPWYLARPSQNMAHAYAIDFFAWPGIRERFIFSLHSYCSNYFWSMHNRNLKVLWQYDFRDCYTVNHRTGRYQLSAAFEDRIADINAWTMGPAFFQQWPEFYGDIPSLETITRPMDIIAPPALPGYYPHRRALPAPRRATADASPDSVVTSPTTREPPSRASDKRRRSSTASLYEHPATIAPCALGDSLDEDALGEDDLYPMVPDNGLLPMLVPPLSKAWDVRASDTIPEHDWLWLTGGMNSGLSEAA